MQSYSGMTRQQTKNDCKTEARKHNLLVKAIHQHEVKSNISFEKPFPRSLSESYLSKIPKFESSNTLQNSIHNVVFSKEKRFSKSMISSENSEFYCPPPLKSARAAGIGIGNKKDFLPLLKTPSPCDYKIMSCFDINIKKNKGITMTSRHEEGKNKQKDFPGPGLYFKKFNWLNKIKGTTMISRRGLYYDQIVKGRSSVSPQSYKLNYSLIENNRFKLLKIGGMGHEKLSSSNKTPGVGTYNLPSCFDISKKRTYALN